MVMIKCDFVRVIAEEGFPVPEPRDIWGGLTGCVTFQNMFHARLNVDRANKGLGKYWFSDL